MSLPRVFSRACRKAIARSSTPALPQCSTLRASYTPSTSFQRPISSTTIRRAAEKNDLATEDPEFSIPESVSMPAESTSDDLNLATESAEANQPVPLPWYLQNRPALSPQQAAIIPDLPPNPPPLLSTLLDYIANTAGLDDIAILDLRHLDPPPALGPKLIMLICTARSEKHLHVAADRFCRYLRREHHLRANAAGLLGRNELKIKLRRKAKRMKMLANVGAIEQGNIDDGIRTNWICCTLGKIEAHPEDVDMPGDNVKEFVGFRDITPGVNIVIQMFTDEKRAETDLETLWGGVLRTGDRKDRVAEERLRELEESLDEEELEEEEEEEEEIDEVDEKLATPRALRRAEKEKAAALAKTTQAPPSPPSPPPTPHFTKMQPSAGDVFPPASDTRRSQQIRRFHSVGLRV
ncbi:hypothetical protein P280DRAFT_465342 [Massarina eburnea CBS 473.64]|uniref:ATPase synthesis protein 25 n=1 Tax=Massarina eburnea CBS 473.64 TaxID=1395130 RepID=A0A6A6SCF1_9PLEO|nr:hypothetical protein P280DRAFT_465342 [Massarina eburnea CBS 473.64]